MPSDRDPQAVHFIKPQFLDGSGLSVREDHWLAQKVILCLLEFIKESRIVAARVDIGTGACRRSVPRAVSTQAFSELGLGNSLAIRCDPLERPSPRRIDRLVLQRVPAVWPASHSAKPGNGSGAPE